MGNEGWTAGPVSPGSPSIFATSPPFSGEARGFCSLRSRAAQGLWNNVGLSSGALRRRAGRLPKVQEEGWRRVGSSCFTRFHLQGPGPRTGPSPSEHSLCSRDTFVPAPLVLSCHTGSLHGWQGGAEPLPCAPLLGHRELYSLRRQTGESGTLGRFSGVSVGLGARRTGVKAWLSPDLCVALGKSPHLPALSFPTWRWA